MAGWIHESLVRDNKFKSEFDKLKILGEGGYGTVYKVKNKNNGKEYAIKRIDLIGLPFEIIKRETNHKYYQHQNIVEYFNCWFERRPPNWSDETSQNSGDDPNLSSFQADETSDNSREHSIVFEDLSVIATLDNTVEDPDLSMCSSFFQTDNTLDNPAVSSNFLLYIQMELCEERDLAVWLSEVEQTVREQKCLSIFKQIVAAVKHIHSNDLFHRDLKVHKIAIFKLYEGGNLEADTFCVDVFYLNSRFLHGKLIKETINKSQNRKCPANFLFGFDGHIKLSDFGTSTDQKDVKTSCGAKKHVTHTVGIGTTLYMAPEVETGHYDYRVDIYSLGVILFELITPFNTEMERREVINKIHGGSFPNEIDDRVKPQIDLLKKILSKNPEDRPTIANIEQCLSEWPIFGETARDGIVSIGELFVLFADAFWKMISTVHKEQTMKVVHPNIEKIVSKSRPQKVKKNHKILQ